VFGGLSVFKSVRLFRALADETRLRILNLLVRGELCVCELTEVLDIGQSKASRHLAYLRNAGLVSDRREGAWMHYSLAQSDGAIHGGILELLSEAQGEIPQALADLRTLDDMRKRGALCIRCDSSDNRGKGRVAATTTRS
jgi:ArsR family transcriptional regulator